MTADPCYVGGCVQEAAPAMATAGGVDGSGAHLMLDLSAARHAWLTKDALLLLLKSGQMLLAHLTIEAGMVKRIKVSCPPPPEGLTPSCPPCSPLPSCPLPISTFPPCRYHSFPIVLPPPLTLPFPFPLAATV